MCCLQVYHHKLVIYWWKQIRNLCVKFVKQYYFWQYNNQRFSFLSINFKKVIHYFAIDFLYNFNHTSSFCKKNRTIRLGKNLLVGVIGLEPMTLCL